MENESIRNDLSKAEYNKEYDSFLQNEINKMTTKHLTEVDILQTEIDKFKKKIFVKDEQINASKGERECLVSSCEMFKAKVWDLEQIIKQKDKELSSRNTISENKMQFYIDQLKEENANLKVVMWQKDSDIEKLKEIIKKKDNIIKENNVEIDKFHLEVLKIQQVSLNETKLPKNYEKGEENSKVNKDEKIISFDTEERNFCCPLPNFVKVYIC